MRMLMIRLQRVGRNKQPSYRLVVSDKRRDPQARHVEIIGVYNPAAAPKVISIKKDRAVYWLSAGAQASATVHNLFVKEGIIAGGKKQRSVFVSGKRQASMQKVKEKAA